MLKNTPTMRHGQRGYYALVDLPQRPSVASIARSTGWWELDQIWRIYQGQFVVVTGIAGSGKSTFLFNVITNLADKGIRSFMYVPENEAFVRERLGVIWGDRQNWDQFQGFECFVQSSFSDDYKSPAKTLKWILDQAIVAVEQDGVTFIMLDPWNELERAKPKDQLMTDYIGECLMKIKQFCRKYNVTIALVAHPTKAGVADGRVPTGYDIEGSTNWANKADNGLTVVRDLEHPGTSRIISWKVREQGAGKLGVCYFMVDEETGIFKPQVGAVSL